jgi:drug/metabolite transporter (DMT)-like permease
MFRNVTIAVAPVAAVNNYLLPLWMIVFGVVLLRHRPPDEPVAGAHGSGASR